jgi:hypothetical protein
MNPEQVARTLAVFDAFLVHARTASVPAVSAHPPILDVSTAVMAMRGNAPSGAADDGDGEVTKVTALPLAVPERTVRIVPGWEEPTHERPDVMRALAKSDAAQPDTDQSIALPKPPSADPRVEQASIIIEDDSLTEPEFHREDVLRAMAEHARPLPESPPRSSAEEMEPPAMAVEDFAVEMLVLVKYGHAAQAVGEIDRWVREHPEHTHSLAPVALSVSRAASRAARRG